MTDEYGNIHIETTLPKPWEEEQSFNDILYDWMTRAPWLVISAVAHLLVFFILNTIPWGLLGGEDAQEIQASIEQKVEEVFEEEEPEIEEEVIEEVIDEPVLQDAEVDELETVDDVDFDSSEGDPDFLSDSPFDENQFSNVLGLGGGAGGKYGQRGTGGGRRASGGKAVERALAAGLAWLADHQAPEGYWDTDDFGQYCSVGTDFADGDGRPEWDVGVTGLALLAFLGAGNNPAEGEYKDNVSRGINWLKQQQDDDGLYGDQHAKEFIYNHALATLAVCETYYFTKSPLLKRSAQKAIDYIAYARDPYGVWRYDVPSIGENDTSITGWMVFALTSAKDAGLKIDTSALQASLTWFDDNTDRSTGRVGYNAPGTYSSRVTGVNDHFPKEEGEAMTAVALLCRIFLSGNDTLVHSPEEDELMDKHAQLLLKRLPENNPGVGNDMYYWYYGTYAMYQMEAKKAGVWKKWENAMDDAIIKTQRDDGCYKGSWDPNGPWGYAGGRVYSTALMTLCMEVFFRYDKVLGSR